MANLNIIEMTINNNEVFVSTRLIAEKFNKRTDNVNRKVREIMEINDLNTALENEGSEIDDMKLVLDTYTDDSGKLNTEYLCNEGLFNELVGSFTGKEARKYRVEFREQFRKMKEQLQRIANGEGDFVDTLPLTSYGIDKYLPQFLNWKNIDIVMPKLVDRCIKEVESGSIKVGVLSSVIKIAEHIQNSLTDVAQKEIMNKYIKEAMLKRDKVYIGLQGAAVKNANKLEAECKRLNEKKYDETEWKEFIELCYNDSEYEMRREEFQSYISYIVHNSDVNDYKEVITIIYGNVEITYGFSIPSSKNVKKFGYSSVLNYLFATNQRVFQAVIQEAKSQAKKLGYFNVKENC